MELSTTDSGKMVRDKEWVDKFGKTVHFTKVTGLMIWLVAKVGSFKPEEMSTKENGLMTKLKVKGYTSIKMVLPIPDSGIMTSNMGMDIRNGQMELNTRVTMLKE